MTDAERHANETVCSRRGFMLAAAVGTAATASAGTSLAQEEENDEENGENGEEENGGNEDAENGEEESGENGADSGNEEPDYEGWLDDVDNYDQTEDLRGEDEVTVEVGVGSDGHRFGPPAIWIDPGTTVVWEWTGEGGSHDVTAEEGPADLSSELTDEAGATYEYTFEEGGITDYFCSPHVSLGMKGAVAVGDDIPTVEVGGEEGGVSGVQLPDTARTIGVATGVAMVSTLGLAYVFMKYGGDFAAAEE